MQRLISFLAGLACGTAIGLAGAILLAPESGGELRMQAQQRWTLVKEEARQASETRRAELEAELARLQRGEGISNPPESNWR